MQIHGRGRRPIVGIPADASNEKLFTIYDLATAIGRSKSTVRSWVLSGQLKAQNLAKPNAIYDRFVIKKSDYEAFVAERNKGIKPKTIEELDELPRLDNWGC